jgi:NADH-quinone oxidoreductase subunit G
MEIIVRIADRMGIPPQTLVPFSSGGVRADMGQSRGAQSGEADRHMVYLQTHGLEPKLSPFDPMALLDEIQRLVPGYEVSRIELLAGNDQHTRLGHATRRQQNAGHLIHPANDDLFSSGTLGKYSKALNSVLEKEPGVAHSEVAAD